MNESLTDSDTISFISVVSLMYNFGKKRMEKGRSEVNEFVVRSHPKRILSLCLLCLYLLGPIIGIRAGS